MFNTNRAVLHVDEDPAATQLIHVLLRPLGIETVQLNDPAQLLDRLLKDQHRVVLLDVDMPHDNGLELLRDIKRLDGGINVIMLTGLVSPSAVLQSQRRGPRPASSSRTPTPNRWPWPSKAPSTTWNAGGKPCRSCRPCSARTRQPCATTPPASC